jgi:hypothetical protein
MGNYVINRQSMLNAPTCYRYQVNNKICIFWKRSPTGEPDENSKLLICNRKGITKKEFPTIVWYYALLGENWRINITNSHLDTKKEDVWKALKYLCSLSKEELDKLCILAFLS